MRLTRRLSAYEKARAEIGGRSEGGKLVPGPAALWNAISDAKPTRSIHPLGSAANAVPQDPATQQPL